METDLSFYILEQEPLTKSTLFSENCSNFCARSIFSRYFFSPMLHVISSRLSMFLRRFLAFPNRVLACPIFSSLIYKITPRATHVQNTTHVQACRCKSGDLTGAIKVPRPPDGTHLARRLLILLETGWRRRDQRLLQLIKIFANAKVFVVLEPILNATEGSAIIFKCTQTLHFSEKNTMTKISLDRPKVDCWKMFVRTV